MRKLVIIGASGHGKVVADIAEKNEYKNIVFLDDSELTECAGFPVVGRSTDAWLLNFPSTDFQIKPEYMWLGIASNRLLYFL